MTQIWLVRHASYAMAGHGLGGRADHALDGAGEAQAARLAGYFGDRDIAAVVASPVRRATLTAAPIAQALGLAVTIDAGVTEIDFGAWSQRGFDELGHEPDWRNWNEFRSTAPAADGETMLAVQSRAVAALRALATGPGEVVVVSHGDVIKSVLAHCLGAPLDLMHRIEIDTASISRIALHARGVRVLGINARA
ncbi:histidine phosphatase family protein [Lichenicoccus sp.]|uniref:histidine phosphatase family protein n=1 Tax=Lichenicoccus sp. TaxID=2781899 RepID=UPI003D102FFE